MASNQAQSRLTGEPLNLKLFKRVNIVINGVEKTVLIPFSGASVNSAMLSNKNKAISDSIVATTAQDVKLAPRCNSTIVMSPRPRNVMKLSVGQLPDVRTHLSIPSVPSPQSAVNYVLMSTARPAMPRPTSVVLSSNKTHLRDATSVSYLGGVLSNPVVRPVLLQSQQRSNVVTSMCSGALVDRPATPVVHVAQSIPGPVHKIDICAGTSAIPAASQAASVTNICPTTSVVRCIKNWQDLVQTMPQQNLARPMLDTSRTTIHTESSIANLPGQAASRPIVYIISKPLSTALATPTSVHEATSVALPICMAVNNIEEESRSQPASAVVATTVCANTFTFSDGKSGILADLLSRPTVQSPLAMKSPITTCSFNDADMLVDNQQNIQTTPENSTFNSLISKSWNSEEIVVRCTEQNIHMPSDNPCEFVITSVASLNPNCSQMLNQISAQNLIEITPDDNSEDYHEESNVVSKWPSAVNIIVENEIKAASNKSQTTGISTFPSKLKHLGITYVKCKTTDDRGVKSAVDSESLTVNSGEPRSFAGVCQSEFRNSKLLESWANISKPAIEMGNRRLSKCDGDKRNRKSIRNIIANEAGSSSTELSEQLDIETEFPIFKGKRAVGRPRKAIKLHQTNDSGVSTSNLIFSGKRRRRRPKAATKNKRKDASLLNVALESSETESADETMTYNRDAAYDLQSNYIWNSISDRSSESRKRIYSDDPGVDAKIPKNNDCCPVEGVKVFKAKRTGGEPRTREMENEEKISMISGRRSFSTVSLKMCYVEIERVNVTTAEYINLKRYKNHRYICCLNGKKTKGFRAVKGFSDPMHPVPFKPCEASMKYHNVEYRDSFYSPSFVRKSDSIFQQTLSDTLKSTSESIGHIGRQANSSFNNQLLTVKSPVQDFKISRSVAMFLKAMGSSTAELSPPMSKSIPVESISEEPRASHYEKTADQPLRCTPLSTAAASSKVLTSLSQIIAKTQQVLASQKMPAAQVISQSHSSTKNVNYIPRPGASPQSPGTPVPMENYHTTSKTTATSTTNVVSQSSTSTRKRYLYISTKAASFLVPVQHNSNNPVVSAVDGSISTISPSTVVSTSLATSTSTVPSFSDANQGRYAAPESSTSRIIANASICTTSTNQFLNTLISVPDMICSVVIKQEPVDCSVTEYEQNVCRSFSVSTVSTAQEVRTRASLKTCGIGTSAAVVNENESVSYASYASPSSTVDPIQVSHKARINTLKAMMQAKEEQLELIRRQRLESK